MGCYDTPRPLQTQFPLCYSATYQFSHHTRLMLYRFHACYSSVHTTTTFFCTHVPPTTRVLYESNFLWGFVHSILRVCNSFSWGCGVRVLLIPTSYMLNRYFPARRVRVYRNIIFPKADNITLCEWVLLVSIHDVNVFRDILRKETF